MVRLLIYLVLFFVVVNLFKRIMSPPKRVGRERSMEGEDMVMDPNCGTYIPQSEALTRRVKGERFSFCSEKCYREYKAKSQGGGD